MAILEKYDRNFDKLLQLWMMSFISFRGERLHYFLLIDRDFLSSFAGAKRRRGPTRRSPRLSCRPEKCKELLLEM